MDQLAISDENGTTGALLPQICRCLLLEARHERPEGYYGIHITVTIASLGARTEVAARASIRSLPDVFNGKAVGTWGTWDANVNGRLIPAPIQGSQMLSTDMMGRNELMR